MYTASFVTLAALCATITYFNRSNGKQGGASKTTPTPPGFLSLRNSYVGVYCLMMAADWLQGPYVYALYESYGFGVSEIGVLFITGFGSSLVFGTIVGSLADRFGRKKACLLYCVLYGLSCVTKHWSDFRVLLLGRLLGGISTSLLFSAFESWVVAEHFSRKFSGDLLGEIFSRAVFFGNGLVAILAGVVANFLVRDFGYGPLAPFDTAISILVVGAMVIAGTWNENYGSQNTNTSILGQFQNGFNTIKNDRRVFYLGCMQGLFEASMYTFVFLWTPAMTKFTSDVPHGFIFANFMIACMVGSALAGYLMARGNPENYMRYVFAAGSAILFVPGVVFFVDLDPSVASVICFASFCAFEIVVGIFWPSMMKMRSKYVPEEVRSTVINIFRMPLNVFVCVILSNVSLENLGLMFFMCGLFLALVCICQVALYSISKK